MGGGGGGGGTGNGGGTNGGNGGTISLPSISNGGSLVFGDIVEVICEVFKKYFRLITYNMSDMCVD